MLALMKTASGPGNVQLVEVPEPVVGPRQVKVRVAYAGICGSDLHIQDNDIQLNLRPPVIMGHEFSGTIVELGEGVEGLQVGQRVVSETAFYTCGRCLACKTGNDNVCEHKDLIGYVHPGVFAEYVVLPSGRIHPLPENVSLLSAVMGEPLACAVRGLYEQIQITAGDVVVIAGPGGMGLLSLQLAKAAGATVVLSGVAGDKDRFEMARQLGADFVVDVTKDDLKALLAGLTDGEGADIYVECSGAPAAARLGLEVTRRRGQYLQLGLAGAPFEIDFAKIAYREIQVIGTLGQKWTAWERALRLLASGQVVTEPLVTETLPLTEWETAFTKFRSRQAIKIALTPVASGDTQGARN
jgi:L-iditol 2-dehydrogenase